MYIVGVVMIGCAENADIRFAGIFLVVCGITAATPCQYA
jgi:hypothetical protein